MPAIGYLVTEEIQGAHFNIPEYPLLPGDILTKDEDGTWMKIAPGLGIGGFTLSPEQEASLKKVEYEMVHLNYRIIREIT